MVRKPFQQLTVANLPATGAGEVPLQVPKDRM